MTTRVIGLILSFIIIGCASACLAMVGKIVEIGGSGYSWEYIPPIIMLSAGIALLTYCACQIVTTID
jgi:hypothetical protein